jgi:hypothetical protein
MSFGNPFGDRFPDMKPINGPPSLFTLNGVGLMVYGERDHDPLTGTYVVTLFFTIVFVPIFAFSAYRVAPAQEGGWYFLGKVPLSRVTRGWNFGVLAAILLSCGGFWWHHHANDPENIARQQIANGDALAAEGKVGAAAQNYQQVANNPTVKCAADARQSLCKLFDAPLDNVQPPEVLLAITIGVESFKFSKQPEKLFDVSLKQARERSANDAATARKILDLIAPIAPPGDKEVANLKKPILEKHLAQQPDDLDALSDLAVVYESEKRFADCEKLLTPKRDQLGAREGARILGQILVNKGQFEQALPLLEPYAEQRLERLKQAEEAQQAAMKQLTDRIVNELKTKTAPGFDFKRAEALKNNHKAQDQMINEYVNDRLRNDVDLRRTRDALMREGPVVAVALDLGIARLRRAQGQADPDKRKQDLEKAEKTFLRIRGVAGQTDEFRLVLGQVYYWLGKHQEGRKLFDEALAGPDLHRKTTLAVANILREVGAIAEARKLLEDRFDKEPFGIERDNLARVRALMSLDLDDRILWLTKVEGQDRSHKAELCSARGDKAIAENRAADAQRELREALGHYAALPESASSLNNSAIAYFSLYRLSGDLKEMNAGIANLEKALELQPRDAILLSNAAGMLLANSLRGIIGNAVDWKTLKLNGSMELLGYLYNDKAKKDYFRAELKKHEGIAKARAYYERLIVLAPKNPQSYQELARLLSFVQDRDALKQLYDRIARAELDTTDNDRRTLDAYHEKNKDQRLKDFQNNLEFHTKRAAEAQKIGGVTLTVALGHVHRDKVGLLYLDQEVEDLVQRAEEAHKIAPARATQGMLMEALLIRAHRQLVVKDAAYAALAKDGFRSLGTSYLIAAAITKEGDLAKTCLAHADVQRACVLLKGLCETYDEEFGEWSWAMLHKIDPAWTAARAAKLQTDDLAKGGRAVAQQLAPLNAAEAYRQHWAHLMLGQRAEADAVLRRAAEKGAPLPK